MLKRCDFCNKALGLFSCQAHEADKDGLCLCKRCYSSFWIKQNDYKIQVKNLARIALSGRLQPQVKAIVVKRIKEFVSLETKIQDCIKSCSNSEKQKDEGVSKHELYICKVTELADISKESSMRMDVGVVDCKSVEKSENKSELAPNDNEILDGSKAVEDACVMSEKAERVENNNPKEVLLSIEKRQDLNGMPNQSQFSRSSLDVTIVSDSNCPDLHFWADTPISICGVTIDKPYLYTVGESRLEEEIDKNLIHCNLDDSPYLEMYKMFFTKEEIRKNQDFFMSYLNPNSVLTHAFLLPKDGRLVIPPTVLSQDELDKLRENNTWSDLLFLTKEQSGCFLKWLSTYYPKCAYTRYLSSRYMNGVWYRAFMEKKDTLALIHFFGTFLQQGAWYGYDLHGNQDINVLRWFLALLLMYTKDGNCLATKEKQLVSSVIEKVLSNRRIYVYKKGWRWDPTAILHECGCDECIPQWLVLRQYLALLSETGRYNENETVQFYLEKSGFQLDLVFSKSSAPAGYLHNFKEDWECDTPYYTTWLVSNEESLDEVIEEVSSRERSHCKIPLDLGQTKSNSIGWFYLPKDLRQEIECPLEENEIDSFIKEDQLIRDVLKRFGFEYRKTIPQKATSTVEGITYFFECIGYKTNIVKGMPLDTPFEVSRMSD